MSSLAIISPDKAQVLPEFLRIILSSDLFIKKAIDAKTGIAIRRIVLKTLKELEVPLPPLEVQREIVEEIEGYQRIIDGARMVVDNWKPNIELELEEARKAAGVDEWEIVKLGDVCEVNPENGWPRDLFGEAFFNYIDISSVDNKFGEIKEFRNISTKDAPSRARRIIKKNDVLLSTVRPYLRAFSLIKKVPEKTIASTGFAVLRVGNRITAEFVYEALLSDNLINQMISRMGKGAYPSINQNDVSNLQILLPPVDIQKDITKKINSG